MNSVLLKTNVVNIKFLTDSVYSALYILGNNVIKITIIKRRIFSFKHTNNEVLLKQGITNLNIKLRVT